MALLDRDKIWYTAWALVPIALVVNVVVGYDFESAHRYEWQASAAAQDGNWALAAETYARAARAEPGVVRFAYNAGAAYRIAGDLEQARRWNDAALQIDPNFELARKERGLIQQAARSGGGPQQPSIQWEPPEMRRPVVEEPKPPER